MRNFLRTQTHTPIPGHDVKKMRGSLVSLRRETPACLSSRGISWLTSVCRADVVEIFSLAWTWPFSTDNMVQASKEGVRTSPHQYMITQKLGTQFVAA